MRLQIYKAFFSYVGALSDPWIILEQISTPFIIILARPLSKESVLYAFKGALLGLRQFLIITFLRLFQFLFWIFGYLEKRFDKKAKVNSFQYLSRHKLDNKELQYTYCQISPEVKIMKFGQLIEYNMRNIFLEKSCTKFGEETSFRLFF